MKESSAHLYQDCFLHLLSQSPTHPVIRRKGELSGPSGSWFWSANSLLQLVTTDGLQKYGRIRNRNAYKAQQRRPEYWLFGNRRAGRRSEKAGPRGENCSRASKLTLDSLTWSPGESGYPAAAFGGGAAGIGHKRGRF